MAVDIFESILAQGATGCAALGFVAASTFTYNRLALVQQENQDLRSRAVAQANTIDTLESEQRRTKEENEKLRATVAARDKELKDAKWQLGRLPKLLTDAQQEVKRLQSRLAELRSDVEDRAIREDDVGARLCRAQAELLKHEQWDKRMTKAREELQAKNNEAQMVSKRLTEDRAKHELLKASLKQFLTDILRPTVITRSRKHRTVYGADTSVKHVGHVATKSPTVPGNINVNAPVSVVSKEVSDQGFDPSPLNDPMPAKQTQKAEAEESPRIVEHETDDDVHHDEPDEPYDEPDEPDEPDDEPDDEHDLASAAGAVILPPVHEPERSEAGSAAAFEGYAPIYYEVANLLDFESVSEDAVSDAIESKEVVNIAHLMPLFDRRILKDWWPEIRASLEKAELIDKAGNLVPQKRGG